MADLADSRTQSDVVPPEMVEMDFEKAFARAEQAKNASLAQVETADDGPETDDDLTTDDETPTDDTPDDDFEDTDDTVEANTPEEAVENEAEPRQEPSDKRKKAKAKAQPEADVEEEDDERPMSRKQRGKLIEELRNELIASEEKRKQLEKVQQQQQEEDERLQKDIDRALGTQEDYETTKARAYDGDMDALKRLKILDANREFYKKLIKKSEGDVQRGFAQIYWQAVSGMPGVDQEFAGKAPLPEILRHLYEAGANTTKAEYEDKIEKLQQEVNTWKGRYRALKPKAGAAGTRSPISSGGAPVTDLPADWKKKLIDPKTGLPTDEAESLILQHGGFGNFMNSQGRTRG